MSGISQDKARVEMGMPTTISANVGSQEHIQELLRQFSEMTVPYTEKKVNSIPGEAEDVTDQPDDIERKKEADTGSE